MKTVSTKVDESVYQKLIESCGKSGNCISDKVRKLIEGSLETKVQESGQKSLEMPVIKLNECPIIPELTHTIKTRCEYVIVNGEYFKKMWTVTKSYNKNLVKKRFWLETLTSINEKKMNRSFPLNPQQFPKAFELNDEYEVIWSEFLTTVHNENIVEEYECLEYDDGVVKRVSTNCLYSIQINKEKAVEKINNELQNLDFAGLYLLIDSFNKRIYTGESSNIKDRIQQHIKNPELPDFEFDKVIVIWDGRPITTTRFGDETLRKSLEKVCIGSFDPNSSKYKSVNTVTKPKKTNIYEEFSNNRFKKELVFLLYKYGLIHTRPSEN